jgi:hypothetical protein
LPIKEGGFEVVVVRLPGSRPGQPRIKMVAYDARADEVEGPAEVIGRAGPAGAREAIIELSPHIYAFVMRGFAN